MKKQDLTKIALMGIAGGLILMGQTEAETTNQLGDGIQIARGGCGTACGSHDNNYRAHRNRRYGGPLAEGNNCSSPGGCNQDGRYEGTHNENENRTRNNKGRGSCNSRGGCS